MFLFAEAGHPTRVQRWALVWTGALRKGSLGRPRLMNIYQAQQGGKGIPVRGNSIDSQERKSLGRCTAAGAW